MEVLICFVRRNTWSVLRGRVSSRAYGILVVILGVYFELCSMLDLPQRGWFWFAYDPMDRSTQSNWSELCHLRCSIWHLFLGLLRRWGICDLLSLCTFFGISYSTSTQFCKIVSWSIGQDSPHCYVLTRFASASETWSSRGHIARLDSRNSSQAFIKCFIECI